MEYNPTNVRQLEELREKFQQEEYSKLACQLDSEFSDNLPLCGLRFSDLEYLDLSGRPRNGYQYYAHRLSKRVFAYSIIGRKWKEVSSERDWATIIVTGHYV